MRTRDIPWVKDFLKRLPVDKRKDVLKDLCKARKVPKVWFDTSSNVLPLAFMMIWKYTPQGTNYWKRIHVVVYGY